MVQADYPEQSIKLASSNLESMKEIARNETGCPRWLLAESRGSFVGPVVCSRRLRDFRQDAGTRNCEPRKGCNTRLDE